jgi:hypothetical protein
VYNASWTHSVHQPQVGVLTSGARLPPGAASPTSVTPSSRVGSVYD